MTRLEFQHLPERDANAVLSRALLNYDALPPAVRDELEALRQRVSAERPGEIAFDLAMNDKGAAIARCDCRADAVAARYQWVLRQAFTDLLYQRGHLTVC